MPAVGAVTATALFIAPIPAILQILKSNRLGDFNTLPSTLITSQCVGWLFYGTLIKDYYVFLPNVIGWSTGMFCILSTFHLSTEKGKRLTVVLLIGLTALIFLAAGVSYISLQASAGKILLGSVTNAILVGFYASPLITFAQIIREKKVQAA